MTLPVSNRAAIEAAALVRKLDDAPDSDLPEIVGGLRALLAADGSSLSGLGDRLASPPFQIMYLRPGLPNVGPVVWPEELRAEAAEIVESEGWKHVRTFEEHRKLTVLLIALRSKKGRMSFDQARIAEGFVSRHRPQQSPHFTRLQLGSGLRLIVASPLRSAA